MNDPDDTTRYASLMAHRLTSTIIGDAKSLDLVLAAARRFAVPAASIGLVGRANVHLVAEIGTNRHVLPRGLAFSTLAIRSERPIIVEDTERDATFAAHPTVLERQIRFLAAAPLINRDGQRLGAFCLIDRIPHRMGAPDIVDLERYAAAAMARIDFLSVIAELSRRAVLPAWSGRATADEMIW